MSHASVLMAYPRFIVRNQIRKAPDRAHSVYEALVTLADAGQRPEMYTGELKSQQPLVRDVVETVLGIGKQTARQVYEDAAAGPAERLIDLDDDARARVMRTIVATLGHDARRQLDELLADDDRGE